MGACDSRRVTSYLCRRRLDSGEPLRAPQIDRPLILRECGESSNLSAVAHAAKSDGCVPTLVSRSAVDRFVQPCKLIEIERLVYVRLPVSRPISKRHPCTDWAIRALRCAASRRIVRANATPMRRTRASARGMIRIAA